MPSTLTYDTPTADELIGFPWTSRLGQEPEMTSAGVPWFAATSGTIGTISSDLIFRDVGFTAKPYRAVYSFSQVDPTLHNSNPGSVLLSVSLDFRLLLFGSIATATTGDALSALRATCRAYTQTENHPRSAQAGYRVKIRMDDWTRRAEFIDRPPVSVPLDTPAARVRQLSGLDVDDLAAMFSVSRTTYHAWLKGSTPRKNHQAHLSDVIALLVVARDRFQSDQELKDWLRTSLAPDGFHPVDALRDRDYDLFRGALLRRKTGREPLSPVRQGTRSGRARSVADIDAGLRRLRSHAWSHDTDTDDTGA